MNNKGKYIPNILGRKITIKVEGYNSTKYRKYKEYERWWINYEVNFIILHNFIIYYNF